MNILKVLTEKRRIGNFGENAAAKFLKKKGYKILERGFICGGSEIDIIARKNDTVAFVEVKTRSVGKESPLEPRPASSVTPEKQKKIISAARYYQKNIPSGVRLRFDVIEVYAERVKNKDRAAEIRHLENTFDLNTAYQRR